MVSNDSGSRFESGKVAQALRVPELAEKKVRKGFVEPEEYQAILCHLPDYLRPVIQTSSITGWRIGEVLSRQWRHVDFKDGWIRLDLAKRRMARAGRFLSSPELREVLQAQRERTRETVQDRPVAVPS